MDELTREFLIESQEGLDRMERCLTELEERPGDAGLIGDIFRSVHTIKGTTGFLGFKRLEKLAHNGENLLGMLRDGKLRANEPITTGLLQLLDGLRSILKQIEVEGNEGEADDAALIARLCELQKADQQPVAPPAPPAVSEPPVGMQTPTPETVAAPAAAVPQAAAMAATTAKPIRREAGEKGAGDVDAGNLFEAGTHTRADGVTLLRQRVGGRDVWGISRAARSGGSAMKTGVVDFGYRRIEVNRGLPARFIVRYFDHQGEEWVVKPALKSMCHFRQASLSGQALPFHRGDPPFDVILLRNVMLYFSQPTRRALMTLIHSMLAPDGVLFLGSTEQPADASIWTAALEGGTCYFRPR